MGSCPAPEPGVMDASPLTTSRFVIRNRASPFLHIGPVAPAICTRWWGLVQAPARATPEVELPSPPRKRESDKINLLRNAQILKYANAVSEAFLWGCPAICGGMRSRKGGLGQHKIGACDVCILATLCKPKHFIFGGSAEILTGEMRNGQTK